MMKMAIRIVIGLVIVLIAGFAWGRLRPPTDAQAQAMALLAPVPPATGTNAWATFWLLNYDIPIAQLDAAYVKERNHLQAWAQRGRTDESPSVSYVSRSSDTWARRPAISPEQSKQLCQANDVDCLARVRANLPLLRDLLTTQSGRIAQLHAIPTDAVLWDDTPNIASVPLPDLGVPGNLRLTAAALDFADGKQTQALAQVCRDARTVRHLHAHTNSFIGAMVTDSWMYSTERLLAHMLVELLPDQAVPEDCDVAFAPVTAADVAMCAPLQREYEGLQHVTASAVPDTTQPLRRLRMQSLIDVDHSRRLTAPIYAWACRPSVIDDMVGDRRVSSDQIPGVRYDPFDALSNSMGLILARAARPDFSTYLNRNEDYAASLRAMTWLLANRGSAITPEAWRASLGQAKSGLQRKGSRHFDLDAAGKHLVMPYSDPRPHRRALILPLSK